MSVRFVVGLLVVNLYTQRDNESDSCMLRKFQVRSSRKRFEDIDVTRGDVLSRSEEVAWCALADCLRSVVFTSRSFRMMADKNLFQQIGDSYWKLINWHLEETTTNREQTWTLIKIRSRTYLVTYLLYLKLIWDSWKDIARKSLPLPIQRDDIRK